VSVVEWLAIRGLQETSERQRSAFTAQMRHRAKQSDRIRELEAELGRVSLLTFALADLCLDTGLVTLDELKARLQKLDLTDGVEDGKIAPGRPLPGSPPATEPPAPPSTATPVRRKRFRPRR
jgi:hypothetical protein